MALIAQKRCETMLKSCLTDLKILAGIYDEYTSALIQFIKVLTFQATDYIHYSKLLP